MPISAICPGCSRTYQLADTMRGKKVRCKSCSEVIVVGAKAAAPNRDEDEEEAIQTARPAKRVAKYEEEDEPRRRPRKERSSNLAMPLLIAGGGVALLVLVLGGGLAVWAFMRSRQPQPVALAANTTPPPVVPAANPPAPVNQPVQDPAPPQNQAAAPLPPDRKGPPVAQNPPANPGGNAEGPLAVELANGQVSGFGAQMQVTVDYRFTSGSPAGKRLFLIIKATKAGGLRQTNYIAELKKIGSDREGMVGARGMTFGIEHGPFEMWMGEGAPGAGSPTSEAEFKRISNVVPVAFKQNTPPSMRPPIGPRRPQP